MPDAQPVPSKKKKIAILGGGAGAMAAAFGLTSYPGWDQLYEITVYQLGWRLGGKGASGRNADMGQRTEEHGIHLWFGFYENAFRMMRQVYDELAAGNLAPGSPFQDWHDAFMPQRAGGFLERTETGWEQFTVDFPQLPGEPGQKDVFDDKKEPPDPWKMLITLLDRLVDYYEEYMAEPSRMAQAESSIPSWVGEVMKALGIVAKTLHIPSLLHLAREVARHLNEDVTRHTKLERECLLHLIEKFLDHFFSGLGERIEKKLHVLALTLDFLLTAALGIIRDGVLENGFYSIDDQDLTEFLTKHGARYPESPIVLSIYDAVFAYPGREPDAPKRRLSAATSLYGNLLLALGYRGSIAWRMCSGMGSAIFAPIYLVLAHRGVRFEFFHRVKELKLNADHTLVDEIDIDVQAESSLGVPYNPLTPVKGLPCWPHKPFYEQLAQGAEIEAGKFNLESAWTEWHDRLPGKTLRRGVDFDVVILGISLGALRWICPELITANSHWRDMVDHVGTVQTQSMQLWLNRSAVDMGAPTTAEAAAIFTSYLEPFDTYADFSHLIPREDWPAAAHVQQIAYFCNALEDPATIPAPFTDPDFPHRQRAEVRENARKFLNESIHPIWPAGTRPDAPEFDWDMVVDQYYRANIDPSERYVLSLPGTAKYRIRPDDSGFANLYIAGDWTCTGLDWGCVESAVMSGLMASQVICGYPQHIYGARRASDIRKAGG